MGQQSERPTYYACSAGYAVRLEIGTAGMIVPPWGGCAVTFKLCTVCAAGMKKDPMRMIDQVKENLRKRA
jgi:hypothetical protein